MEKLIDIKRGTQIIIDDEDTSHKAMIGEMFSSDVYRVDAMTGGKKDLVVLDLGANIGIFTASIKEKISKVVLVEPNPKCVELLKKNLELNGLTKKAIIFEGAIAPESGLIKFHCGGNSGCGYTRQDEGGMEVKSFSVAEIMKQTGIKHFDLVKIDIENGEYPLLIALGNEMKVWDALTMEFHTHDEETFKKMYANLEKYFTLEMIGAPKGGGNIYGIAKK